MCVQVHACTLVCRCGNQRSAWDSSSLILVFKAGSLSDPGVDDLARLASHHDPGGRLTLFPALRSQVWTLPHLDFMWVDRNSDLPALVCVPWWLTRTMHLSYDGGSTFLVLC